MIDRREFLRRVTEGGFLTLGVGLLGCGKQDADGEWQGYGFSNAARVVLYDTYAMALYMDGGLGPKTGILKVDYVIQNQPVTLQFWHGHGGKSHYFTLTPEHFRQIKQLKKTYVETTVVDGHTHKLFMDPSDPRWRVPGAIPVNVPDRG